MDLIEMAVYGDVRRVAEQVQMLPFQTSDATDAKPDINSVTVCRCKSLVEDMLHMNINDSGTKKQHKYAGVNAC